MSGSPSNAVDEVQVLRRFRVVFNAVRTHFRQIESSSGLGGAQVWALGLVRDQPALGVNDIARGMDIHQSTASNLVKTLLKKQLITLEKSSDDKRVVRLHITELGRDALSRIPGPFEGVLPSALRQLEPAMLQRLDADLTVLIEKLNTDDQASGTPLADL